MKYNIYRMIYLYGYIIIIILIKLYLYAMILSNDNNDFVIRWNYCVNLFYYYIYTP